MHNPSFPLPGVPGAQTQPQAIQPQANMPPGAVPVTPPAPQQPMVGAQTATQNLLPPPAMAAQQAASLTAAPLLGAQAGSKRNAPDSGFDQPTDGNDARRWAAPPGPQAHGQMQPQGFPWFQPAPLVSSSSAGNMHFFGGQFNFGIAGPDAGGQFAANTAIGSDWLPALPGMPVHGMHSSGAGAPPALIGAVVQGDMQAVYLLLADPHTDVNITDGMGYTALMHAASKGDPSLVFALLSRPDTDVHACSIDGRSAFVLALNSSNLLTWQILSSVTSARLPVLGTLHSPHAFPPIVQAPFIPLAVDANATCADDLDMLPPPNESTKPALIQAFLNDDLPTFRALLADPGIDVNASDENGQTALHHAVYEEDPVALALLLAKPGIDVNASDKKGRTALHHAAMKNCASDIIDPLLAAPGITLHAKDNKGLTPFDMAVEHDATAIIRLLFASQVGAEGATPDIRLALAAAKGELALVEALLADPDIDVNAKNEVGTPALMLAAANGHVAVVRRLLAAPGIDANLLSDDRLTALHLAAENGNEGVLRSMLDAPGIDINVEQYQYGTPLMAAMRKGKENAVLALLAMPSIDISNSEIPALKVAVEAKETILNALLAMPGIDVNASGDSIRRTPYWLPLIHAARRGHEANVRVLLAMPDIDVNAIDYFGDNALLRAVKAGHEPVVRILLAMPGIRIDIADKHGNTALSIAMKEGHDAIATALRNHVPAKPAKPATVLHLLQAIFTTHADEPQQSASSSADIAPRSESARKLDKLCESLQFGTCPAANVPALFSSINSLPGSAHSALALSLAFGFFTGHYRNVAGALDDAIAIAIDKAGLHAAFTDALNKLSLAAKHINLCRVDGMNLLGIAAKAGNERMIRGLVRLGAYVNVPSPNDKTALAIAVENRQWGACAELVSHGALPTLPIHDGHPALYHIVQDFCSDEHSSPALASLIRYLRIKGVPFDIPVKNPDDSMREAYPMVPLYELLASNAQSWISYGHIVYGLKDDAPPTGPAPANTTATTVNLANSV